MKKEIKNEKENENPYLNKKVTSTTSTQRRQSKAEKKNQVRKTQKGKLKEKQILEIIVEKTHEEIPDL